jgi:Tfp pilus assembly protein PilF
MRPCALILCSLLLAACATTPAPPVAQHLFADQFFAPPVERVLAADVFALSEPMRRYLAKDIASDLRNKGYRQGLVDALYRKEQLKLEYDSTLTRNAAQAFEARAGNCLSLVIMTAALAKELGLPVRYQSVPTEETWSRTGDLYFLIGHVNLAIGKRLTALGYNRNESDYLTIDFLPATDLRGRTKILAEETIIAMYMNNRAVEFFADGRPDDAYWTVREAIAQDPGFMSSYNTLGAIYQQRGHLAEAERTFAHVLEREPENTRALSNRIAVLKAQGHDAEAKELGERLARLDPDPPFRYFDRGVAAMRAGDFKTARDLFTKEIAREAYYHEFHFWLALAYAGLGDIGHADEQLALAMENSTTRNDRDRYAAKLDRIRAAANPPIVRQQ